MFSAAPGPQETPRKLSVYMKPNSECVFFLRAGGTGVMVHGWSDIPYPLGPHHRAYTVLSVSEENCFSQNQIAGKTGQAAQIGPDGVLNLETCEP